MEATASARLPREAELHSPLHAAWRTLLAEQGPLLARIPRGYEADPERQRDLHQEILVALWRALPGFQGHSSLRTWALRVAHNTGVSHVLKQRRGRLGQLTLEELETQPDPPESPEVALDRRAALLRLEGLVQALAPLDRQLVLMHLEGLGPAEISEVSGLSANLVSVKLHRLRALLARRFKSTDGGAR